MDLDRLHPQARAALGAQRRAPLTTQNIDAVRGSMVDAVPAEAGAGPDVRTVAEVDADGVPARLYTPGDGGPVLVYAHGGGWVMGDLETHDGLCRHLARASGWRVLSVAYRRPPETPFPGPIDDVGTAVTWARTTLAAPGGGPAGGGPAGGGSVAGRGLAVAVGGDSAGAHLAAVVARRCRDAGTPLAAQVLICPALDPAAAYPDLDDYGLHRDEMRFFWDAFLGGADRTTPEADPFRSPPAGLPPAVLVTAELDILRDEGERYAAHLQAGGVPVIAARYQGVNHNFVRKLALFDAAHAAVGQVAAALHRLTA